MSPVTPHQCTVKEVKRSRVGGRQRGKRALRVSGRGGDVVISIELIEGLRTHVGIKEQRINEERRNELVGIEERRGKRVFGVGGKEG